MSFNLQNINSLIAINKKKNHRKMVLSTWQRAIFTMASIAIFTAGMLNFCVRDGNRCDHSAIATRSFGNL